MESLKPPSHSMKCQNFLSSFDQRVFDMLNARQSHPCYHDVCYRIPLTIEGSSRTNLLNTCNYLGVFREENPSDVIMFLFSAGTRYNFVLWEYDCTSSITGERVLIPRVSFISEQTKFTTYSFTIHPITNYFVILFKFEFPGDSYPWYYPLIHFPTFKYVSDLCIYLIYKSAMYFYVDIFQHIDNAKAEFRPLNRLSVVKPGTYAYPNYSANSSLRNGIRRFKTKGREHKVPQLQQICCRFIRFYNYLESAEIELSPRIPYSLKPMIHRARYTKHYIEKTNYGTYGIYKRDKDDYSSGEEVECFDNWY